VTDEAKQPRDTKSEGTRGRCAWEVTAGVIPGQPMPEYTRRWFLTGETWERENAMSDEEFKKECPDGSTFLRFRDEADDYAKHLHDPRSLNWVRVEWIWF
jgi:hypothetical protein